MTANLFGFVRIFVAILLLALIAQAQEDEVVKVKSNLVNIDVIVKDKKGKYISDLKAEDFVITENGQPQKIEFFDAPLAHGEMRKAGEATTTGVEPAAPPRPPTPVAPRNYVSLVLDFQSTDIRSEEHTSELQSPYVISYAVF